MTTSKLDGRTNVVSSTTATAEEDEDDAMLEELDELLDMDEAAVDEDVADDDIFEELAAIDVDVDEDEDDVDFFESLLPPHALKIMTKVVARP